MKPKYNWEQKAYEIWNILTTTLQPITYGELAKKLGIHHRLVRYTIAPIYHYCRDMAIPPLTMLVVRKDTKMPG